MDNVKDEVLGPEVCRRARTSNYSFMKAQKRGKIAPFFILSDRSSPITALWNFVNIRRFTFQAFLVWATLGIPGNIVTLYLFNDTSSSNLEENQPEADSTTDDIVENKTEFTCHEVKAEWQEYVALSKLYIQGISLLLLLENVPKMSPLFRYCCDVDWYPRFCSQLFVNNCPKQMQRQLEFSSLTLMFGYH